MDENKLTEILRQLRKQEMSVSEARNAILTLCLVVFSCSECGETIDESEKCYCESCFEYQVNN